VQARPLECVAAGAAYAWHEVPIAGGRMTSGIVRRGDRLLRPMGPWSPAVHEYPRHLEAAGFDGSPRVLGTEGNREVLTFIDGDVAMDPHWQPRHGHQLPPYARSDAALPGAAELIRKLHSAAAGFAPVITSYRFDPHPPQPGEVVSHGDLGPWNTVYRDGIPVAFIDWDSAGPVDPLADLAAAAWTFVPLAPPEQLAEAGFDPLPGPAGPAAHVRGRLRPSRPEGDPDGAAAVHTGPARPAALAPRHRHRSRSRAVTRIRHALCPRPARQQ
jgi:hypothetical protein